MKVSEPLFPCYIFFRCLIEEKLNEIKHTSGVSTVVHFAQKIPQIADAVIEELKECFEGEETMTVEDRLSPGDEVVVAEGAFSGMRAFVLRVMPARRRVQVLLDVLGRPTPAEVDESSVVVEGNKKLQELNKQFFDIDSPTDVLSFPSNEVDPETGMRYIGDVIISYPRTKS